MDEKIEGSGGIGGAAGSGKRLSAKRKLGAALRLLRGESLETVSREMNVPVHRLSEWRERALMAAESALKDRERDERDDAEPRKSGPRPCVPRHGPRH